MSLIESKITDRRFSHLIRKCIKAGYLEFTTYKTNIIGTPQGNIISPILANIYLHEFDKKITNLIPTFNICKASPACKEYKKLSKLNLKFKAKGNFDELRKTEKLKRTVTAYDSNFNKLKKLNYVRYADEFLIGIKGTHGDSKMILDNVITYLDELKLVINTDKSKILNMNNDRTEFLGVRFRKFQRRL